MWLRFRLKVRYHLGRATAIFAREDAQAARRDLEREEITRDEAVIARLEIAAAIGSMSAQGLLVDMADDRVGCARRRMAQDALGRLRQPRSSGMCRANYP
jgi:hypothetical protein